MAKNVTIAGASYSDVPAVEIPKTGGGVALFMDADGFIPNEDGAVSASNIAANAVSAKYTATIATEWSGTAAPYTKAVTITGITANDQPVIDLNPSTTFATAQEQLEAWGMVYRAVTAANKITFYATDKPTVAIPVKILCVRK